MLPRICGLRVHPHIRIRQTRRRAEESGGGIGAEITKSPAKSIKSGGFPKKAAAFTDFITDRSGTLRFFRSLRKHSVRKEEHCKEQHGDYPCADLYFLDLSCEHFDYDI